ncbi:hypothetical protein A3Q56_06660 [Intoshia linei]|uniref:Uncharacterized protein n=1 Tax=Intoshia linei TaxID=1819745 RepID=A0A177AVT6_9BILA|nr:hypothetical protein A3Q56_06660 [Intoshia linei]
MSQLAATINLNNTYVLLEKLMHVINKNSIPKCEDLQIFRNLSIRIYRNFEKFSKNYIINLHDKSIILKIQCSKLKENSLNVKNSLLLLQTQPEIGIITSKPVLTKHFFDSFFENNMLKCLNHTISKVGSNSSKGYVQMNSNHVNLEPMRNLVIILQDSGFVEYLLHTTSFYANNVNSNSEILYESLFLLTKSFSSNNDIIKYFRKYNTINTCYSMLKIHTCKINVVYTVILVLHRAISQNIGIDMMNKCRLIKILVRLLSMHKRKNYIFEIIMEILVFVTKSKSMVPVLVGVKGISLIIKIMNEKMRNLKNASSIISGIKIIKNISQTNQGTTHFLENEGLSFINSLLKYNVIFEVNIKILTIIHLIIQRCTPKQKLPIDYACLKNKDQFNGQSILKNGSKSGTSSSLSKTADGETLYDSDSDESIDSLCTEGYRVFFDENSIIKSYNYQKVNETLNLSKNETIQRNLNMIKAYPDVNNITSYDTLESLTTTNDANKRTFIIQDLKRNFETENIINRVVFDVDEKIVQNPCYKPYSPEKIPNISKSVEDEML